MAIKVQRQHLVLPTEVTEAFSVIKDKRVRNAYIVKLKKAGWTLDSIGVAVGITREGVRHIVARGKKGKIDENRANGLFVPMLPYIEIPDKEKRVFVEPDPIDLARLLELQPFAQQVRSHSPAYRLEAEEYTWLIHKAHHIDGVTLYRLALRLGVTHGALRFRLARYGYKPAPNAKSKSYDAILDKNRAKLT